MFLSFFSIFYLEKLCQFLKYLVNIGAIWGLISIVLYPSFIEASVIEPILSITTLPLNIIFFAHLFLGLLNSKTVILFFQTFTIDLFIFCPLFAIPYHGVHPSQLLLLRQAFYYLSYYLEKRTLSHLANAISEQPARLITVSFGGVILLGTFILSIPISLAQGQSPSFLTALFTSTSAVCVTGLTVVDTANYFSLFGKFVLMVLIQIGGLGIMTLSAVAAIIVGKRMAISQQSIMQNVLDQTDLVGLIKNLKEIAFWTLVIEGIGTLVLSVRFYQILSCKKSEAFFLGLFHSISAFCNAGFSLFPDSLIRFADDFIINFTIIGLITTGGLGFSVLGALVGYLSGKQRLPDVNMIIVLTTSALLVMSGTLVFLLLEADNPTLNNLSTSKRFLVALFQAVTTRTAGFNTIDICSLKQATLFFFIILMFIGASPGSTGGGIKTTTFAIMLLALNSQLKNQTEVVVLGRTIPIETVTKAFLITAMSASIIVFFTFLLILVQDAPIIKILFEVVSAFGTVGLSCNFTPSLNSLARVFVILLMFIGRIGPLTLALSVWGFPKIGRVYYPTTRIQVG